MRIHRPHVGPLLWDGYAWEGDLRLPIFARCEQALQSVPVLQRDPYEPPISPDTFPLTLLQANEIEPLSCQLRAVQWLKEHEPITCIAVLTALLPLFREFGLPLWQAEEMSATFLRLASTLDGIRQTVRLVGVTVFDEGEPMARTGFEFAADWAPWEGLGVVMCGAKFIGYGELASNTAALVTRHQFIEIE